MFVQFIFHYSLWFIVLFVWWSLFFIMYQHMINIILYHWKRQASLSFCPFHVCAIFFVPFFHVLFVFLSSCTIICYTSCCIAYTIRYTSYCITYNMRYILYDTNYFFVLFLYHYPMCSYFFLAHESLYATHHIPLSTP